MSEQEGVIQFNLFHDEDDAQHYPQLDALIKCHQHMHVLGLIDQDPKRYGGYAYGNISQRLTGNEFIISGTQTGGINNLTANHYAHVVNCDIANNTVQSSGPIQPSSECMSHSAIYSTNPTIMAVIHIHNPEIWQHHHTLKLSTTAADIDYGTPEMAVAIQDCVRQSPQGIAMLGHLDGVICFASDIATADKNVTALYQQAQFMHS